MTREEFITHAEACQGALRRFLTALCCGDGMMADDLAQEALVKAWLSLDGLVDVSRFNAWVFRIAYNTFVSARRSMRPTVGYDEAQASISPDRADASMRYEALYAALERLSPQERGAILLFYMQGYSIKEISAVTGASESAVKQHLSRGREHLRGLLSNDK